jgi:hypothetical protein
VEKGVAGEDDGEVERENGFIREDSREGRGEV